MGDTGVSRFPGNLDPRAQEFIPGAHQLPYPSPSIFYPYQHHHHFAPPPSPPFPAPPSYVSTDPSFLTSVALPPTRNMPSRALLLSMVPADVSESTVRRELEVFGDVRAVQMERVRDGIVTVHFYDLRQAQEALVEIQEQHMQQQFRLRRHYDALLAHNSLNLSLMLHSPQPLLPPAPPPARGLIAGRAVWAQFTVPVTSTLPDGTNQGTLVIFNLEPAVTPNILKQIFQTFGHVKELRETPRKRHQRFVEFYDTRDAARALMEMNGKEIQGRHIVIEFSRPGGYGKKCSSKSSNKINYSMSNNIPAGPSSQALRQSPPPLLRKSSGRWLVNSEYFDYRKESSSSQGNPNGKNGEISRSTSNSSGASLANSMASLRLSGNLIGNNGGGGRGGERCLKSGHSSSNSKNCKKRASSNNGGASASTTTCSGGSTSKHYLQRQRSKGSRPWKGSSRQSKEYDPRFLINEDAIIDANSRDSRTTVMIKNIPNKYSQKLLLNMLDNHCIHCNEQMSDGDDHQPPSSYDFVYLPIDFVNKCNVGYGFVNMTSPEATLRLYKAFHRQSWEVFNSRKICEVTYARLQGLEALKEHFKNSKFPYDIDEYMPVIFSPPRDGRQLTEPLSITGRFVSTATPIILSSSPSSSPGASCQEDYYSDDGGDSQANNGHDCSDRNHINDEGGDGNGVADVDDDDDDNQDMYSSSGGGCRSGSSSNSSSNGGVSGEYDDSDDVE